MSVNHMINHKQNKKNTLGGVFFIKDILSSKKIGLVSTIFPIYNVNKIYTGNPQVKLFQPT